MTDLHIHTEYSFDSDESPENYVKEALSRGDGFIGFSEHCEYNMADYDPDFPTPDFDGYFSASDRLSDKYADIKILKGVELGYSDSAVSRYKALLKKYPFDHVILSVHTVGGRGDCYFPTFYDGLNKREAYSLYLEETLKAVRSDVDFQILGHVGYIARYAPYSDKRLIYSDFPDVFDKILRALIDRGAALELNTSAAGVSSDVITDKSVIGRYIELGGRIFTFGSDAHSSARYAENADRVKQILSSFGVDFTVRYENRKPIVERFT